MSVAQTRTEMTLPAASEVAERLVEVSVPSLSVSVMVVASVMAGKYGKVSPMTALPSMYHWYW